MVYWVALLPDPSPKSTYLHLNVNQHTNTKDNLLPLNQSLPRLTRRLPLNLDEAHLLLLQRALNPLYID